MIEEFIEVEEYYNEEEYLNEVEWLKEVKDENVNNNKTKHYQENKMIREGKMNCKSIKDEECNYCSNNHLCRTFLGLKKLDEYDDTDTKLSKMDWNKGIPIIVTARRNPLLGIEIEANVNMSSVPGDLMERINKWAKIDANRKLRQIVDTIGVTKTFMGG